MPNNVTTFASQADAETALIAEGFTQGENFWRKAGTTQGSLWDPPHASLELVSVEHRRVDPKYCEPDYFELVFQ